MQLDLFTHSRDVMLQNDVITALRERNTVSGWTALAVLKAEFPQQEILAPLKILLNALAAPTQQLADHNSVASRLATLDTVVTPAANRVFGHKVAGAWLSPLWLSLAHAVTGLPFNPDQAKTHSAFMLLQGSDWVAAETAVARIPSWRRIPVPLAWMAEARCYRGGLESAWSLLLELAWIDAVMFSTAALRLHVPSLHKLLHDFDAAFEDNEAPSRAWFPAWLLITAPAMARVVRETQPCNGKGPERGARLILELLDLEKQGRHADLVAQRKKLRDLHAELYALYMASR